MGARERILEAAIACAVKDGYAASSVTEIAERAGVSRQALYRYYPAKDDLFRACAESLQAASLAASIAAAEAARAAGKGGEEAVFALIDARFDGLLSSIAGPHVEEMLAESDRICGDITIRYLKKFAAALEAIIEAERKAGRLKLRAGLSAAALTSALMAGARGVKHTHPPLSRRAFRADLRRMVELLLAGAAISPRRAAR